MYIKLDNDFQIDREKEKEAISNQEITTTWLQAVIVKGYEVGLTQDKRRIYALIVDKINKAIKEKADYLELNVVEYLFVKSAFETAVMDPKVTTLVTIVETAFLNAVPELPTQAE